MVGHVLDFQEVTSDHLALRSPACLCSAWTGWWPNISHEQGEIKYLIHILEGCYLHFDGLFLLFKWEKFSPSG